MYRILQDNYVKFLIIHIDLQSLKLYVSENSVSTNESIPNNSQLNLSTPSVITVIPRQQNQWVRLTCCI